MPRFEIREEVKNELKAIVISDRAIGASARILPEYGGNLAGLSLYDGEACLTVVEGYETRNTAAEQKGYRGALLFPFPNRIRDGRFSFRGEEFQLPINRGKENNAIHGFFTHQRFELIRMQADDHSGELALVTTYDGSYAGYPFRCEVTLCYQLSEDRSFSCSVSVTNLGESEMPVGVGWHPYFSLSKAVDQLQLKLPACDILLLDERKLPLGERVEMEMFQALTNIGCTEFDTAFALTGQNHEAVTTVYDPVERRRLELSQTLGTGGYNYLQVYIPADRATIALEPMTCPADSFNSGEGLIELGAGASNSCRFEVRLIRDRR
jgi:aldose 1-epimerase